MKKFCLLIFLVTLTVGAQQINPDEILSINTVKLLYDKVRMEVKPLEDKFKFLEVEEKFPLINHLLKESGRTFHDE